MRRFITLLFVVLAACSGGSRMDDLEVQKDSIMLQMQQAAASKQWDRFDQLLTQLKGVEAEIAVRRRAAH